MCKKLVELHKGMMWRESVVDKGSTFSFVFPILEDYSIITEDYEECCDDNATSIINIDTAQLEEQVRDNYNESI
jgi:hypothetical protein